MHTIKIINYQGNKNSLMPFISENIKKYITAQATICDAFSGSGSVGAFLKNDYSIIANDSELYSYIISSALLNTPSQKELKEAKSNFLKIYNNNYNLLKIKEDNYIVKEQLFLKNKDTSSLIKLYQNIPTIWNSIDKSVSASVLKKDNKYNLFLRYYAGTYFGIEQAICIDAIIKTIHEIDNTSSRNVLMSCLFFAMAEVSFSKDGHLAQPLSIAQNANRHLKQRSKSVIALFILKLDEFIQYGSTNISTRNHIIYNKDISELLKDDLLIKNKVKLVYADPPYTDMQYSRYYHLLNVAARYDYPAPTIAHGKFTQGLYTEGRNQSDLSKKSSAKLVLQNLYDYCYKNNIILALSYGYPKNEKHQKTDRYTISIEELVLMAKNTFGNHKVQIERINYKHANNRNSLAKEVYEYLIICGQETHKSYYNIPKIKTEIKNVIPTSRNPIYNTHLYWSQKSYNIVDILISHLSNPGDIVFDPFMGSGVTIIEAINNEYNRSGIGCDVNEMPKFIVNTIIEKISSKDLEITLQEFKSHILSLNSYYNTKCPICNNIAVISKVVFDKPERIENKFNIKAISYTCHHCGKQIKDADEFDYHKMTCCECDKYVNNLKLIPNSKIAVGETDTISDLFTPRNFSVLNEIVRYIISSKNKDILNYLLMSVMHLAKITDTHSNSQWPLWIPKVNCVEKNIIDLLCKKINNLLDAKTYINQNYSNSSIVSKFKSLEQNKAMILTKGSQFITDEEIPDNSVSLIITDPPYMDQVLYSEYMQLYKPFIGLNFNIDDEIIVSSTAVRKRNKDEYFSLLNEVFYMCSKKLKENHIMCLFFHDSNLDVWVNLMNLLSLNGFKFISLEHIQKLKTVKNILSPKKSLSGDAILFFENTKKVIPTYNTSISIENIEHSVFLEAKKLLEKHGDLSTPELYDMGIMEMLIDNGWLNNLSHKYKTLVEIFEKYFIWKREVGKWHLQN